MTCEDAKVMLVDRKLWNLTGPELAAFYVHYRTCDVCGSFLRENIGEPPPPDRAEHFREMVRQSLEYPETREAAYQAGLADTLDNLKRRLLEQDIAFATLLIILEERGVCTREEFFRCKAAASPVADQIVEDLKRKREEEDGK